MYEVPHALEVRILQASGALQAPEGKGGKGRPHGTSPQRRVGVGNSQAGQFAIVSPPKFALFGRVFVSRCDIHAPTRCC